MKKRSLENEAMFQQTLRTIRQVRPKQLIKCRTCGIVFLDAATDRVSCSRKCDNEFRKSATLAERIERRVDRTGECHIWRGARTNMNYGVLTYHGKSRLVHRAAFEVAHGREIKEGLFILHKCDNPPCINPDHLYEGTQSDNMRDKVARGRQSRGKDFKDTKLNAEMVRAIRKDPRPRIIIAEEYGICRYHVYNVQQRKFWKHIK